MLLSKAATIALLGGATGAVMFGLAKARPSSTAGANVPVDEELVPRGYVVDPAAAAAEHLNERGRGSWFGRKADSGVAVNNAASGGLLRRGQVGEDHGVGTIGTRTASSSSTSSASLRGDMPAALIVEDAVVTRAEKKAHEDAERARLSQAKAQTAAAEAAAAVAATSLLKKKEAEAQQAVQAELDVARQLEEAAARHREAAEAARRLASKEHRYVRDAEAEAARKLREERKAMERAVQEAETARAAAAAAENRRLAAIDARNKAAEARMRDSSAKAAALAAAADREAAAAADAKRKADADAAAAQQRLAELASAERAAAEASRREQETRAAIEQARSLLANAEASRRDAEARAVAARRDAESLRARQLADRDDASRHSAAATEFAKSHEVAEREAAAAAEAHREAQSIRDRLSAWWTATGRSPVPPSTPLAAVSEASGKAYARPMADASGAGGTMAGVQVVSEGDARVRIVPADSAPPLNPAPELHHRPQRTLASGAAEPPATEASARSHTGFFSRLFHPTRPAVETEATLAVEKASVGTAGVPDAVDAATSTVRMASRTTGEYEAQSGRKA